MSERAIERKHHVGRRTIVKALDFADPPARKKINREPTALRDLHEHIDAMIETDPAIATATIWQRLADDHGATVAYPILRTTLPGDAPLQSHDRWLLKSTLTGYCVVMNSVLEALNAPERAIRHLIEEYGATQTDLKDIGLSDYKARKWSHSTSPRPLTRTEAVQISPVGLPDTAAVVPMNDELGRRYLRHDVYIHLGELSRQIRLRATHLGWSDNGRIEVIRPITRRWRIGSGAAIATLPVANVAAITSEPDLESTWNSESTLLELGSPIAIGLPLGFRPTRGAPAIPGVLHFLTSDLINAAKVRRTLVGTPTL